MLLGSRFCCRPDRHLLRGGRLPDLDLAVRAAGDDPSPIRREGRAEDAGPILEGQDLSSRVGVPDPGGVAGGSSDNAPAVGREGPGNDTPRFTPERQNSAAGGIPHSHHTLAVAHGNAPAVRGEGDLVLASQTPHAAGKGEALAPGFRVPHPDDVEPVPRGDLPPIGGEGGREDRPPMPPEL